MKISFYNERHPNRWCFGIGFWRIKDEKIEFGIHFLWHGLYIQFGKRGVK